MSKFTFKFLVTRWDNDKLIFRKTISVHGRKNVLIAQDWLRQKYRSPYLVEYHSMIHTKTFTHYISFLDSQNGFKETKKDFESYSQAIEWGKRVLSNFNFDMVKAVK